MANVGSTTAQEGPGGGMPDQAAEKPSQSLTINAGRMGGEVSVEASNDFYSGKVEAMRDEYSWEYKRSGAAALVGSTLAFASVALHMA